MEAGRTPSLGLEVTETGRVNGGACGGPCEPLGGMQAAVGEGGDQDPEKRQTGRRDSDDGELGASSAIDLTMYSSCTPTARDTVQLFNLSFRLYELTSPLH